MWVTCRWLNFYGRCVIQSYALSSRPNHSDVMLRTYFAHVKEERDNFGRTWQVWKKKMRDSPPNWFVQYYPDCAASIDGQHHLQCSAVAWTRSNSSIQTYLRIYLCSRRSYQQLFWNRKIEKNLQHEQNGHGKKKRVIDSGDSFFCLFLSIHHSQPLYGLVRF